MQKKMGEAPNAPPISMRIQIDFLTLRLAFALALQPDLFQFVDRV